MLGSPGGFSGGNGSRFGAGGSSLSRMPANLDARREGEAVGCNRVAEQGSDCSMIFGERSGCIAEYEAQRARTQVAVPSALFGGHEDEAFFDRHHTRRRRGEYPQPRSGAGSFASCPAAMAVAADGLCRQSTINPLPFHAPTPWDAYRQGLINRWELERLEGPTPQALQGPSPDGGNRADPR